MWGVMKHLLICLLVTYKYTAATLLEKKKKT